ncbi:hypothetical protein ACFQNF_09105 [Iodobacter arcticus]|uniref:Uncharacterized protein n=1 Tax=Iodobacter arcticus TaxID=590593 RepID=A0ABW2QWE7_9NEIS
MRSELVARLVAAASQNLKRLSFSTTPLLQEECFLAGTQNNLKANGRYYHHCLFIHQYK